jgi:hypothetical protein
LIIKRQLRAVTEHLIRRLGVNFNRVAAVSNRTFIARADALGNPPTLIDIDPIYSLTGLVITVDTDHDGSFADETAVVSTYYRLLPLNATDYDKPYTQLEITPWGSQAYWPTGLPIQITALWGWPSVPEAVVEATIELVAIWRGTSLRATSRVNEFQQVVSSSRRAQSLLDELLSTYRVRPIAIG